MGEFGKKIKGRVEQAVGGLTGKRELRKEGNRPVRGVPFPRHTSPDVNHAAGFSGGSQFCGRSSSMRALGCEPILPRTSVR